MDFISKMFVYNPKTRLKPLEGLLHPFFDDLRSKNVKINGRTVPDLFNFTKGNVYMPNINIIRRTIRKSKFEVKVSTIMVP